MQLNIKRFFSGLAVLFWKVYNNRRSQIQRPNQIQIRPPLTKVPSVDG